MMFDYVTVHADTVILDDEKPIGGIPANDDFSGRGDFPVFRVGSSGGNVRLVATASIPFCRSSRIATVGSLSIVWPTSRSNNCPRSSSNLIDCGGTPSRRTSPSILCQGNLYSFASTISWLLSSHRLDCRTSLSAYATYSCRENSGRSSVKSALITITAVSGSASISFRPLGPTANVPSCLSHSCTDLGSENRTV